VIGYEQPAVRRSRRLRLQRAARRRRAWPRRRLDRLHHRESPLRRRGRYVAAHLWDLPTQISVESRRDGTALAARISW
jgi:hypothetical protein